MPGVIELSTLNEDIPCQLYLGLLDKNLFNCLMDQSLMMSNKRLPPYYLQVSPGGLYQWPPELLGLPLLLAKADLDAKERIKVSYSSELTLNPWGTDKVTYYRGPLYEEEGVLLGERILYHLNEGYDYSKCGFKLWLLSVDRLALHLFYEVSNTYGRTSGPGYTGYEEIQTDYIAPLRMVSKIEAGGISLENETKELIEVNDIRRVEYSYVDGADTRLHILDWDEEKGWWNSYRYSYGSPTWQSCSVDGDAVGHLKKTFKPIAEKLGVEITDFNTRKLVDAATKDSRGFLGSYRQRLYRKQFPREIERGEIPSIKVGVYSKIGRTMILLREVPLL